MYKKLQALILSVFLLCILVSCKSNTDPTLPQKEEAKVKQAYLALDHITNIDADDLTLRVVWQSEELYGLYIDSPVVYTDDRRLVQIEERNEDGTLTGKIHCFWFPNQQILYIYKNGGLYTITEAYDAGILTQAHLRSLQTDEIYQNNRLPEALKLSTKENEEIKKAYLAYINNDSSADNVVLHMVLRSDNTYILYAHLLRDSVLDMPDINTVLLKKQGEDSDYYGFSFINNRQLYVYKAGSFYTLKEAWDAQVLTSEQVESLLDNDLYKNNPGYWGY